MSKHQACDIVACGESLVNSNYLSSKPSDPGCATALRSTGSFDVVVYGGTAGGAMTAVSAARMGLKVALLEPRKNIGGMASGGLSRTDVGTSRGHRRLRARFYWRAAVYVWRRYLQDLPGTWSPKWPKHLPRHAARSRRDGVLRITVARQERRAKDKPESPHGCSHQSESKTARPSSPKSSPTAPMKAT